MGILDKQCEQRTGMAEVYRDFINSLSKAEQAQLSGLNCEIMVEPLPLYESAPCEVVLGGHPDAKSKGWYGSYIVLGRDRPETTSPGSLGYGPKGCTGASMIDLVVGRNAAVDPFGIVINEEKPPPGSQDDPKAKAPGKGVSPNFKTDAARIYISQRSDIDDYYGVTTQSGGRSTGKSSCSMKADAVRLIAREGVKIVSGFPDPYNSQGTAHGDGKDGIYLIYANKIEKSGEYSLQPMVKGNNLKEVLRQMCDMIGSCVDWLTSINMAWTEFMTAYASHQHISPGFGSPDAPMTAPVAVGLVLPKRVKEMLEQGINHSQNHAGLTVNFFEQFGGKNICSRWHKLN